MASGDSGRRSVRPADRRAGSEAVDAEVGVVFALAAEAGGLFDRLDRHVVTQAADCKIHAGRLAGRRVAVVVAGAAGGAVARRATERLLAGHRPSSVISAGFAGGLDASLPRHAIFLATEVIDMAGTVLPIADPPASADRPDSPAAQGRLLSIDRLVRRAAEKRQLGAQHHARAVDMETWSVVDLCLRRQTPVRSVRVISDTVDDELPEEIARVLRQPSPAGRAGAVIGAVWRRPAIAKDLWRLQEVALVASDHLAAALEATVERLP